MTNPNSDSIEDQLSNQPSLVDILSVGDFYKWDPSSFFGLTPLVGGLDCSSLYKFVRWGLCSGTPAWYPRFLNRLRDHSLPRATEAVASCTRVLALLCSLESEDGKLTPELVRSTHEKYRGKFEGILPEDRRGLLPEASQGTEDFLSLSEELDPERLAVWAVATKLLEDAARAGLTHPKGNEIPRYKPVQNELPYYSAPHIAPLIQKLGEEDGITEQYLDAILAEQRELFPDSYLDLASVSEYVEGRLLGHLEWIRQQNLADSPEGYFRTYEEDLDEDPDDKDLVQLHAEGVEEDTPEATPEAQERLLEAQAHERVLRKRPPVRKRKPLWDLELEEHYPKEDVDWALEQTEKYLADEVEEWIQNNPLTILEYSEEYISGEALRGLDSLFLAWYRQCTPENAPEYSPVRWLLALASEDPEGEEGEKLKQLAIRMSIPAHGILGYTREPQDVPAEAVADILASLAVLVGVACEFFGGGSPLGLKALRVIADKLVARAAGEVQSEEVEDYTESELEEYTQIRDHLHDLPDDCVAIADVPRAHIKLLLEKCYLATGVSSRNLSRVLLGRHSTTRLGLTVGDLDFAYHSDDIQAQLHPCGILEAEHKPTTTYVAKLADLVLSDSDLQYWDPWIFGWLLNSPIPLLKFPRNTACSAQSMPLWWLARLVREDHNTHTLLGGYMQKESQEWARGIAERLANLLVQEGQLPDTRWASGLITNKELGEQRGSISWVYNYLGTIRALQARRPRTPEEDRVCLELFEDVLGYYLGVVNTYRLQMPPGTKSLEEYNRFWDLVSEDSSCETQTLLAGYRLHNLEVGQGIDIPQLRPRPQKLVELIGFKKLLQILGYTQEIQNLLPE